MKQMVNLFGKVVPAHEAMVSVFDRGFLFGDGVYETGRTHKRCCLHLEEHIKRLRKSAESLAIPVPWTDGELVRRLNETCRATDLDDVYFRIIITRGTISHVGLEVAAESEPTLVIITQELPARALNWELYSVKLHTSSIVRNSADAQDPNIKTSNYLNSLLALQDAKRHGADDAVMCDRNGNVAEGTTFAMFGVNEKGVLITPSLQTGLLDSITRRHVLRIASATMKCEEKFIPLSELQACKEVFIASSIRAIIPVSQWDKFPYPTMGETTLSLRKKLIDALKAYADTHPKY